MGGGQRPSCSRAPRQAPIPRQMAWIQYDPNYYPVSDFKYAPHKVWDFHARNPTQPGPPKRLDEWKWLWEAGDDTYDHKDDDKPAL
jgi:hypothetical protein